MGLKIAGPNDGATPYDDAPDWIDLAEKWLNSNEAPENEDEGAPIQIISGFLELMDDEGLTSDKSKEDRWRKKIRVHLRRIDLLIEQDAHDELLYRELWRFATFMTDRLAEVAAE